MIFTREKKVVISPTIIWRNFVFRYEVVVTTHAGHAHELVITFTNFFQVSFELNRVCNVEVSSASDSTLSRWLAVVCVSGDGLVYEVYNALYARQRRWEAKRKQALEDGEGGGREGISNAPLLTPIGLMPGGSGCALNCSLLRYRDFFLKKKKPYHDKFLSTKAIAQSLT